MVSTNVRLPDGSEAASSAVVCEGCGESMDNHSCGAGGVAPASVVYSRSTGKRKDPRERPQCPHCLGPVHFSMPGGLQNTECIMRQFFVSAGVMPDAYQRLPIWTADTLEAAARWAQTNSKSYGRMESATGGAGTYAALRPKKGAGAAVIEEVVAKEEAKKAGRSKKSVVTETLDEVATRLDREILTEAMTKPVAEPVVDKAALDREARRARRRELLSSLSR